MSFRSSKGAPTLDEPPRVLAVSDGCLLRILEGLMTLQMTAGRASGCPTVRSTSNRSARSTRP